MRHKLTKVTIAVLSATTLNFSASVYAKEDVTPAAEEVEAIQVTGIRSSLTNALAEKRERTNLVEIIEAVDIGKMPDQNLAEVLENVTGIQITRTAGVGTGVQIRGTNSNRTEINGVSTVGSGSGRSGINFEDVSAGIIAGLEVTKSPSAKTVEGSVGGTINLKTIRPLQLEETLASFRVQGESSSLSTDGITPRLSGTFGDNWETEAGKFGVVLSASYAKQDVTAFRPRVDRDNSVSSTSGVDSAQSFDFLPIQFLVQDYDNYEYDATSLAGTFEWQPNDNTKFFFDAVVNDQERRQESSRIQASGISGLKNISIPTEFVTVDFGSLGGQDLGTIQAAAQGVIPVEADGSDGNLRFSSDTNSRLTKNQVFRIGGEWTGDTLSATVELSSSSSDTSTPSFNTTLNFINPNVATNSSNENGTPFEYDLTGGSLTFGIASGEANAPTVAQLLDPANIMLRDVNIGQNVAENKEDAFRTDFTYYLDTLVTSVDFGYRYSKTSSMRDQISSSVGIRNAVDAPTGDLFADLLVAGPTNFNAADGRELYVRDFLLIDPELVASDPNGVLTTLQDAMTSIGSGKSLSSPTSSSAGFFDIEENTHALYLQANFEHDIFRGNFGLRYLKTDITSQGNSITEATDGSDVVSQVTTTGSYDFVLPRLNLVADVSDDVIVRVGLGKDIRRPDFDDLSTSFTFSTSPNPAVQIGNPDLRPELVTSFDISAEWYFAEASLVSIGYFHKKRSDLHVSQTENPVEDSVTGYRDLTDPCEGGGIYNPIADVNVFGPDVGVGVCVPVSTVINDTAATTQKGIEIAVQYDLSTFEEDLGWASGFGVLANYTIQKFSGGEASNSATSRAGTVFALTTGIDDIEVSEVQGLLDLSEKAYNFTLYYEKYGLSARARYTWRSAYRTEDFGSTSSKPWGFPVVQAARGQLNASVSYDVTDKFNIGLEAVNITQSDVSQYCVNDGAMLCFQGLTDRRITFGANYRF